MKNKLSSQSITIASSSFLLALVGGALFLFGTGGANAATVATCHISSPTETVNEFGNHVISWTGTDNCSGVSINLVSVSGATTKVIQSSDMTKTRSASFTYGVLAKGSSYEFQVVGTSAGTAKPVTLKTVVGS